MNTFILKMQSSSQFEQINQVSSFVGKDKSGTFGLQANHARMMTSLNFGLCWYRQNQEAKKYIALTGGLLYFVNNQLTINSQHYFLSEDYNQILKILDTQLQQEASELHSMKRSIRLIDEKIIKYLWQLNEL